MTDWKEGEGMRGYCKCTEQEAAALFRKRYGREPEKAIKVGWYWYLGPVEVKHGK